LVPTGSNVVHQYKEKRVAAIAIFLYTKTMTEITLLPAYFDVFGVVAFIIITVIAGWGLHRKTIPLPRWTLLVLLAIGLLGLLVDVSIVTNFLVRPNIG